MASEYTSEQALRQSLREGSDSVFVKEVIFDKIFVASATDRCSIEFCSAEVQLFEAMRSKSVFGMALFCVPSAKRDGLGFWGWSSAISVWRRLEEEWRKKPKREGSAEETEEDKVASATAMLAAPSEVNPNFSKRIRGRESSAILKSLISAKAADARKRR
ncbi:uncharacterized protein A4U43_C04F11700 [Asparagus officinalis]|uniref:Uncharacterized protein n=1 Tax=Asparagus officinalis TaxID=4686 RepID=A0A5P1F0T6_ASPOF|nr:uncharacterized protein A4U43_C04F11700 [Asparagus officinalis]